MMKRIHEFFDNTFGMIYEKFIAPFKCNKEENSKEKHVKKPKNIKRRKCKKNTR